MTNYSQLTNHKWLFYGIRIEAEEPRMNAELRGMIAKLQPKSNWTKLKTIPRAIFIHVNRDETYHINEN